MLQTCSGGMVLRTWKHGNPPGNGAQLPVGFFPRAVLLCSGFLLQGRAALIRYNKLNWILWSISTEQNVLRRGKNGGKA